MQYPRSSKQFIFKLCLINIIPMAQLCTLALPGGRIRGKKAIFWAIDWTFHGKNESKWYMAYDRTWKICCYCCCCWLIKCKIKKKRSPKNSEKKHLIRRAFKNYIHLNRFRVVLFYSLEKYCSALVCDIHGMAFDY